MFSDIYSHLFYLPAWYARTDKFLSDKYSV